MPFNPIAGKGCTCFNGSHPAAGCSRSTSGTPTSRLRHRPLADLSTALAEAGVPIVAISTYDTDYLLIKDSVLSRAVEALVAAGHNVTQ